MNLAQLIDAIPVVQTVADRTQRFSAPPIDQRVWNKETKAMERWDGAVWQIEFYQSAAQSLGWFDVKAGYLAKGDGIADDGTAMRAAIAAAHVIPGLLPGGIVYFPSGKYLYTGTLQQLGGVNSGQVNFKGSGMRTTYLLPSGNSGTFTANSDGFSVCWVMGSLVSDAAGSSANNTAYQYIEDMSISGTLIGTGSVIGLQLTQAQKGTMRNVIIEDFPNASLGLYLRGSTITAGLGAAVSGPHCWKCLFENVLVVTIGSNNLAKYACVLQNADENVFIDCNFGCRPGMVQAADSIKTFWIQIGRNNKLDGCLQSGDTSALKTAYDGIVFGPPTNWAGAPNGQVLQNQDYAAVIEGFNVCVVFGNDPTGNTRGNFVHGFNPSIYNTAYVDNMAVNAAGFGNGVFSPLFNIWYYDGQGPAGNVGVLTVNSTTPSVANYNTFVCANTNPTVITQFAGATVGQAFHIRLDANTTVRDVNNGGGGDIRLWGRQDIVGQADMWVHFVRLSGVTYQIAPQVNDTLTGAFAVPSAITQRQIALGWAATVTGLNAAISDIFFLNATSNIAATVPAPTTPPPGGQAQRLRIIIKNSSGGALTTPVAFAVGAGAFLASGGVSPANGLQIAVDFTFDQANNRYVESNRGAAV